MNFGLLPSRHSLAPPSDVRAGDGDELPLPARSERRMPHPMHPRRSSQPPETDAVAQDGPLGTTSLSWLDAAPFRIEVSSENDALRVTPVGELDMATVDGLQTQVQALFDAGAQRLVLDLRQLSFMDVAGLRLLLTLDATARQNRVELALVGASGAVYRVLDATGMLDQLPFGP